MINQSEAANKVIECCNKEGITLGDIFAFCLFYNLCFLMNRETMLKNFKQVIHIPPKKEKGILSDDRACVDWAYKKLVKRFYKKPHNQNMFDTVSYSLKYVFLNYYFNIEKIHLGVEKTFLNQAQTNHAMNLYGALIISKECPEILENFSLEPTFTVKTLEGLIRDVEKKEKLSHLKAIVDDSILIFGTVLYRENHKGKNEIKEVLTEEEMDKTFSDMASTMEETAMEAIQEAENKEEEIKRERQEYSQQLRALEEENSSLKKRIEELESELNRLKSENELLANKYALFEQDILVVGDSRRRDGYRKIVEQFGGNFLFVDAGEEPQRVSKEAFKADLIVHITAYGRHIAHNQLQGFTNVIYVNNAGLESFKNSLMESIKSGKGAYLR